MPINLVIQFPSRHPRQSSLFCVHSGIALAQRNCIQLMIRRQTVSADNASESHDESTFPMSGSFARQMRKLKGLCAARLKRAVAGLILHRPSIGNEAICLLLSPNWLCRSQSSLNYARWASPIMNNSAGHGQEEEERKVESNCLMEICFNFLAPRAFLRVEGGKLSNENFNFFFVIQFFWGARAGGGGGFVLLSPRHILTPLSEKYIKWLWNYLLVRKNYALLCQKSLIIINIIPHPWRFYLGCRDIEKIERNGREQRKVFFPFRRGVNPKFRSERVWVNEQRIMDKLVCFGFKQEGRRDQGAGGRRSEARGWVE